MLSHPSIIGYNITRDNKLILVFWNESIIADNEKPLLKIKILPSFEHIKLAYKTDIINSTIIRVDLNFSE